MDVRMVSSTHGYHCIITKNQHHELHIPTQPNETNYGYYVMQTIRMLVAEFVQSLGTQANGTNYGYYVMQMIRRLVEEFIQGLRSLQIL